MGSTRAECEALERDFICCFWDDGTDQSGYCEGTHSDCSKCAPTKGDCDILSQCEWVDTTPQCLSSDGEVTSTCSSANSKATCEANGCCWTARRSPGPPIAPSPLSSPPSALRSVLAPPPRCDEARSHSDPLAGVYRHRCSCVNNMPDSRCPFQHSAASCSTIAACTWTGDCGRPGYSGDGPFCPPGPPPPPPALNCVYTNYAGVDGWGQPLYVTCDQAYYNYDAKFTCAYLESNQYNWNCDGCQCPGDPPDPSPSPSPSPPPPPPPPPVDCDALRLDEERCGPDYGDAICRNCCSEQVRRMRGPTSR